MVCAGDVATLRRLESAALWEGMECEVWLAEEDGDAPPPSYQLVKRSGPREDHGVQTEEVSERVGRPTRDAEAQCESATQDGGVQ